MRTIFDLYLELKSVADTDRGAGAVAASRPARNRFGVGGLAYLLRNRFYIGEVAYRGEITPDPSSRSSIARHSRRCRTSSMRKRSNAKDGWRRPAALLIRAPHRRAAATG